MAYILGFFTADGNLTLGKRGNKYLEFTSTDKDIMLKIRRAFNSNHKITGRKRRKHHKTVYRVQIGSKIIFDNLTSFGFKPNKSKDLSYPPVPSQYFQDFVRGYFDGDGHVTTGVYKRYNRATYNTILFSGFTSGCEEFLKLLHEDLKSIGVVAGGTLYYQKGFRLNFSNRDSLSLYRFLYKNMKSNLYLPRKKKMFERYINGVVAQPG